MTAVVMPVTRVIARSECDEAIHLSIYQVLDCFACARNDGREAVIPGRIEDANPESIGPHAVGWDGFRARSFHSRPGMTPSAAY